jgi:quercetin dioxygenase-like cupin family protein
MSSNTEDPKQTDASVHAELDSVLIAGLTPLFPPSDRLQAISSRLDERIAKSIAAHAGLLTVREKGGVWCNLKKGIRTKHLWHGPAGNSVLIEFAAGASLPVHRHNWLEEGIVLKGGLQMGDLELSVFDYHLSPEGSRHDRIQSRQGALAYLRGTAVGHTPSVLREILGGMLPFKGNASQTVFFTDMDWIPLTPGVLKKDLYSDGIIASRLFRFEPGAKLAGHPHLQNEECMMLSGEIFLGDILLRAGDYQMAPTGSYHGEASTDVGALLFVRGAAD